MLYYLASGGGGGGVQTVDVERAAAQAYGYSSHGERIHEGEAEAYGRPYGKARRRRRLWGGYFHLFVI